MKVSAHKPVLLKESLDFIRVDKGTYLDCTLGGGGHSDEIIRMMSSGCLIAFDMDVQAIKRYESKLLAEGWEKEDVIIKKGKKEVILVNDNYAKLQEYLEKYRKKNLSGIIADLGISSDQIEDRKRGFSYMKDGPLDMRMSNRMAVTASDLVNGLYQAELEKMFRAQDEKYAKRIAAEIVEERKKKKIKRTLHLVKIIKESLPHHRGEVTMPNKRSLSGKTCSGNRLLYRMIPSVGSDRAYWKKPVMRVFQALRIAVNSELSSLLQMLPQALGALAPGGRMVVISFHSGEDRIVKKFFKEKEMKKEIRIITKKPIRAKKEDVYENIRSRSAKLRAIEKI